MFFGRYGRYDRAVSEKKSFVPAESIDYGHGEVDKEKKKGDHVWAVTLYYPRKT